MFFPGAILDLSLSLKLTIGQFELLCSFIPIGQDDIRSHPDIAKSYFLDGKPRADRLKNIESIREILTSDGRTLVQGALCWIWGKSNNSIPIPGFKSVKQIKENAGALASRPLNVGQMTEIERLLGRA